MIAACDATATIPLHAGAESLNVAAAAAIGLQRISSLAAPAGAASDAGTDRTDTRRRPGPRSSRAGDAAAVEDARVRFLGRKAELTTILRGIGELPPEQRGPVGKTGNEVRQELEAILAEARERHERAELDSRLAAETIDVTLPGTPPVRLGHLHPLTRTRREIEDIFVGLGYTVMEGPEVEHDYYNFTALNYPPGHPARMLQDTFYVDPGSLGPRPGASRLRRRAARAGRRGRATCCSAPTPRRCRSAAWRTASRRSSSSSPAASTAATPTPPTRRCSTRSRGSPSASTSRSPTSTARC